MNKALPFPSSHDESGDTPVTVFPRFNHLALIQEMLRDSSQDHALTGRTTSAAIDVWVPLKNNHSSRGTTPLLYPDVSKS
jgi:hypothetical protein